jgi:hypothetical protein
MKITTDFIKIEINNQNYEISLHADDERIAENLTITEVECALLNYEIIEHYPDDPRGVSCLTLGYTTDGIPIHIVCGRTSSNHLFIITVYIPKMPKWKDPHTRNK